MVAWRVWSFGVVGFREGDEDRGRKSGSGVWDEKKVVPFYRQQRKEKIVEIEKRTRFASVARRRSTFRFFRHAIDKPVLLFAG